MSSKNQPVSNTNLSVRRQSRELLRYSLSQREARSANLMRSMLADRSSNLLVANERPAMDKKK